VRWARVCVCASFQLVNLNVIDNECVATLLTLFSFSFSHRNYYDLSLYFFLSCVGRFFFLIFQWRLIRLISTPEASPPNFALERINEREESPPTIN
jgi:hypothetical protein